MVDNIFYIQAIQFLYPNEGFTIDDMDYSTLKFKNDIKIPSEEDIDIVFQRLKSEYLTLEYQRDRASEYPSITDQLDMLWHMMDDETIPGKNSEWYNTILLIKQQFPKPE